MAELATYHEVVKKEVTELEIIVRRIREKPYFEIKYKEVNSDEYMIGYGSYDLNIVFHYRDTYFTLVKDK